MELGVEPPDPPELVLLAPDLAVEVLDFDVDPPGPPEVDGFEPDELEVEPPDLGVVEALPVELPDPPDVVLDPGLEVEELVFTEGPPDVVEPEPLELLGPDLLAEELDLLEDPPDAVVGLPELLDPD